MHPTDHKANLREQIEERLAQLSDKDRNAESRTLCREVLKDIPEDAVVCAYYPLKTEANLKLLLGELITRGQSVYLPTFEEQVLNFRKFEGDEDLISGELNIPEPSASAPHPDPDTIDIVLVPGRGFDRTGGRLGRGNGGYDIWIEKQRNQNPNTVYWGMSLECQLIDTIPMEEHDENMDAVYTARGRIDVD